MHARVALHCPLLVPIIIDGVRVALDMLLDVLWRFNLINVQHLLSKDGV